MTVKEVEERTGLPRANIRYYESEGLIHPVRYGRDGVSQRQLERLIDRLQEFPYLPLAWEREGVSVDYQPKVRGYNKDVLSMSPGRRRKNTWWKRSFLSPLNGMYENCAEFFHNSSFIFRRNREYLHFL